MADIFECADASGPAKVVHVCEPSLGLRAVLVVDNVARGPSVGGLRMAPDVSVEECARLARAMTLKNSAAGLAHGGGKSVLWGDPRMPRERKERLIRAFAHALRNEQDYIFGPDMGTDEGVHGVDQGRDRPLGGPAGGDGRHPARRDRRDRLGTQPRSRGRGAAIAAWRSKARAWRFRGSARSASTPRASWRRRARGSSRPPTRGHAARLRRDSTWPG